MKKQILAVMATLMMLSSTIPSYAAVIEAGAGKAQEQSTAQETTESTTTERKYQSVNADPSINWIINPDEFNTVQGYAMGREKYGTDQWWACEAVEQARKWAEDNKGDVESIADEKARYEAICQKVCDFLTYDEDYKLPHIAYTIRDGKGVCADYTTLTKALCDICNIQTQVVDGYMNNDMHDMLKVTLNGQTYYSDPTNYDSGLVGMLMDSAPSYFEETAVKDGLLATASYTGFDFSTVSFSVKELAYANRTDIPEGYEVFYLKDGEVFVLSSDMDKLDSGELSWDDFYTKYNITF